MSATHVHRAVTALGVLIAAALIAVGCGGSSSGAGAAASSSDVLGFVPESALLYVVFDTDFDGDNWTQVESHLKQFKGYETSRKDALDSAFSDADVSYAKDIEPWLGKTAGAAVLKVTKGGDGAQALAWADVKDEAKLKSFMSSVSTKISTSSYDGTTITKAKGKDKDDDEIFWAVKDSTLLFADDQNAIESSLKAAKDGSSITDNDGVKRVADEVGDDTLVAFVLSGDAMRAAVKDSSSGEDSNAAAFSTIEGLKQYQALDGLAVGFGGEESGMRLHGYVGYDSSKLDGKDLGENFEPKLMEQLPSTAFFALGARDLGGQLKAAIDAAGKGNDQLNAQIAQGEGVLGFTMDDLSKALGGEHALGVGSGAGPIPPIWFVTEDQGDDTATVVTKLLGLASFAGAPAPKDVTVGGVKAKQTTVSGVSITAGSNDGNTIVTTDPEFVGAYGKGETLGDSSAYKDAADAASVPSSVSALFYVDVQKALGFAKALGMSPDQDLAALKSVVAWGESSDDSQTFDMFIRIDGE